MVLYVVHYISKVFFCFALLFVLSPPPTLADALFANQSAILTPFLEYHNYRCTRVLINMMDGINRKSLVVLSLFSPLSHVSPLTPHSSVCLDYKEIFILHAFLKYGIRLADHLLYTVIGFCF